MNEATSNKPRVAVIGCGTMGLGIARAALSTGHEVVAFDSMPGAVHRARSTIQARDGGTALGVAGTIAEAVHEADIVIEAVVEDLDVKADVLRAVAAQISPGAIVATNTSTFQISRLAAAASLGERLVGLHFFNPAHRMLLVEVALQDGHPGDLRSEVEAFVVALGKTPVLVRDSPGFVTSRISLLIGNEAMSLLQEGIADVRAIDTAMKLGAGHPMGPLELADLIGLDARLNNLRALAAARDDERYAPPRVLEDLVRRGHLGRKTGRGFYHYDQDGRQLEPAVGPVS